MPFVEMLAIRLDHGNAMVSPALLERLAALLERVEWAGSDNCEDATCADPECAGYPIKGHKPDCELAALKKVLGGLL